MCRYAALLVACTKLLHCVGVPGTPASERYLFVRGTTECNYLGWQLPLIVSVAVLVAVPLLLPLAAKWSLASHAADHAWRAQPWRLAVRLALVESYHRQWYWWESVLMAQRLVRPTHEHRMRGIFRLAANVLECSVACSPRVVLSAFTTVGRSSTGMYMHAHREHG